MGSQDTNIQFSAAELSLMQEVSFFEAKRMISGKIAFFFAELGRSLETYNREQAPELPAELLQSKPKISRGENYRGLPWMVLDFPRVFTRPDCFAFRTLFWWGHPLSFTLLISGKYLDPFANRFIAHLQHGPAQDGLLVCVNATPWEHHFGSENYLPHSGIHQTGTDLKVQVSQSNFLKVAVTVPLAHWDLAQEHFTATYQKWIGWLSR